MTFSVECPKPTLVRPYLAIKRVVAAEQQPVRPAVEAEPGRRGLDRVRRERGRVDGPGDRGQQLEIGLQLVGILRGADRDQLRAVDAQVDPVAGLAEGGDGAEHGAGQHGPGVPGIRRRAPEGTNQYRLQAAVRRTAAPRRTRRDPARPSAAAGWPAAGRTPGRPRLLVYSNTRNGTPAAVVPETALVDLALEAQAERRRVVVQHPVQRRAGVEGPSPAPQRPARSAADG